MKYTKKQRKEIAGAFRAAKGYLYDGVPRSSTDWNKSHFICYALNESCTRNHIKVDACINAEQVVRDRLGGCFAVEDWLHEHAGIPYSKQSIRKVQKHRHDWLDLLVKEFEN